MTPTLLLAVLAALSQPPTRQQPAPSRPSPSAQAPRAGQRSPIPEPPAPLTPYDSTVHAIMQIGTRVAEVRSGMDLLRRAAFNDPDGIVLERAELLRTRCRDLAAAADRGQRMICRGCQVPSIQRRLEAYRSQLPSLGRLGRWCAGRVQQLRTRGAGPAAARALRSEARPLSTRMVEGLVLYEEKLLGVRRAFGWAQ